MKSLEGLTGKQLSELVAAAAKRQAELAVETVTRTRERILKVLADEDLTLEAVFGARRAAAAGPVTRSAAKYRNPADPAQTWGGHGKRPFWLRDALKAGKALSDFAIGASKAVAAKPAAKGKAPAKQVKAPAKAAKKAAVKAKAGVRKAKAGVRKAKAGRKAAKK